MAYFSVFQIFSVLALCVFLIGLLNNLLTDKENGCEMTYMFEYPQFVKINVVENNQFPQYGLYAYSEGRFTERARKMRFDGVPVLFLPGNGGSYKQVRSLASVALRKAIPLSKYGFHFDYFAVDFNEELSGLFGGVLEKQMSFSSHSMRAILSLYESNRFKRPESVIVIGHSMGGIVARSLLMNSQSRNLVHLILTMASPHERPVITIDPYYSHFYGQINDYWKLKVSNTSQLTAVQSYWKKKVFITIGGGQRDFLVPSALISSDYSDLSVLTTAIPGVWLSTDHLCIMWCKQLILVLNRLLFSVIDPSTKQLSSNSTHIINMGKHFLKIGYSKNYTLYNSPVEFIPDANWYEDSRRQYSIRHERINKTWYYMIRLIDLIDYEEVTVEVVDSIDKEWIFGCQAKYVHGQNRVCLSGRHLSHFSHWSASKSGKRRIAILDLHTLRVSYPHWTHILFRISPINRPVEIHVDIHSKGSRQITANLPGIYSFGRHMLIKQTDRSALQYNITLFGLNMLYQSYLLHIDPLDSCGMQKTHHATAEIHIPWAEGYENYHFITESLKTPMKLRLLKGNPVITKNNTQSVNVALTLDPQCKYQISVSVSFYDMLGQFSRHYITSLPAYLAAILLLVLRHWAAIMESKQNFSISFHAGLCSEYLKPYYILLAARLGAMVVVNIPLLNMMTSSLMIGGTSSQNFLLLPLILYIIALGMAHILGAICWGFIIFSGQIAYRVLLRLVSFGRGGGNKFWEWVAKEIGKAPGLGGFILIAIAMGSCGAASLVAGVVFYFFLLTKLYEDYLEDFVYKTIAKVAKKIGNFKTKKRNSASDNTKNENEDNSSVASNIGDNVNVETTSEKLDENVGLSDADKSKQNEGSDKESNQNNENSTESSQNEGQNAESNQNDVNNTESNPRNRRRRLKLSNEAVLNSLHFHFIMFFLMSLMTILNIPTLLTWAHNFKYSKILETDPSFYPSLIISISAFSLWQIDVPKKNIKYYDILQKIIYITAVLVIMITPVSLYRLNYLLSGIFFIVTLHQTFPVNIDDASSADVSSQQESESGDNHSTNVNNDSLEDKTASEKMNDFKTKLDSK